MNYVPARNREQQKDLLRRSSVCADLGNALGHICRTCPNAVLDRLHDVGSVGTLDCNDARL